MATGQLKMEDVAGVRSRISWPAILAGAILAVATNLVLTLFFAAIGLTVAEANVRASTIGTGALVAALVGIIVSMFVGGWASTQLTAGENERESILYGILTWALVVGFSLAVVGMGVRAGYFALVGGSMIAQQTPAVQEQLKKANPDAAQQKLDEAKQKLDEAKNDPEAQARLERAERATVGAAWAAFVGIMLSMAASIGGAMAGRGVAFRLLPVGRAVAVERREVVVS